MVHRPIRHHVITWTATSVVVIAVAITGYANRSALASNVRLATTRQPSTYAELSLDYQALPQTVKAGTRAVFTFTVRAHGAGVITYPYQVTTTTAGVTKVIESGELVLNDGSTVQHTSSFSPRLRGSKTLITVTLTGLNQSVHFWSQS